MSREGPSRGSWGGRQRSSVALREHGLAVIKPARRIHLGSSSNLQFCLRHAAPCLHVSRHAPHAAWVLPQYFLGFFSSRGVDAPDQLRPEECYMAYI